MSESLWLNSCALSTKLYCPFLIQLNGQRLGKRSIKVGDLLDIFSCHHPLGRNPMTTILLLECLKNEDQAFLTQRSLKLIYSFFSSATNIMNAMHKQSKIPWQRISREHVRMQVGGSDVILAITLNLI